MKSPKYDDASDGVMAPLGGQDAGVAGRGVGGGAVAVGVLRGVKGRAVGAERVSGSSEVHATRASTKRLLNRTLAIRDFVGKCNSVMG